MRGEGALFLLSSQMDGSQGLTESHLFDEISKLWKAGKRTVPPKCSDKPNGPSIKRAVFMGNRTFLSRIVHSSDCWQRILMPVMDFCHGPMDQAQ